MTTPLGPDRGLELAPGSKALVLVRKVLHAGVGLLAFLIAVLGPVGSAVLAAALVVLNTVLLPRCGGRWLWRQEELERGRSIGIPAYPLAVLALILLFWDRLEVAAAIWGILAFGDGAAGFFGAWIGRRELPWNPDKSWAGTAAYWVFGTVGAAALLIWTRHHLAEPGAGQPGAFLIVAAALTALFAAVLESQPQGLDDNVSVPLPAALVLLGLLQSQEYWTRLASAEILGATATGAGLNLVLSVVAWRLRAVDISGAVAGWALGTTIYTFLGWRGFLLLGAFLVLGSAATRVGFGRKLDARLAQESGGQRSARHALANAGVATIAAVFAGTTPFSEIYVAAVAGAFAAALGDTLSSEIGQLWGRRPVLITTGQPVAPGTDGGVSAAGTLAGALGSAAIAVLAWGTQLIPTAGLPIVLVAGLVGNLADSLLGATLERRHQLDNEGVNFANTLCGALAGAGMVAWI